MVKKLAEKLERKLNLMKSKDKNLSLSYRLLGTTRTFYEFVDKVKRSGRDVVNIVFEEWENEFYTARTSKGVLFSGRDPYHKYNCHVEIISDKYRYGYEHYQQHYKEYIFGGTGVTSGIIDKETLRDRAMWTVEYYCRELNEEGIKANIVKRDLTKEAPKEGTLRKWLIKIFCNKVTDKFFGFHQ